MFFQVPQLGFLFGLLLVILIFYLVRIHRKRRFALRYTNSSLVREIPRTRGWRRHIPPFLFFGTIAFLILGLMRPSVIVRVPSDEATVIVTMDVSASMWATDLLPTRMEAAKQAAELFVDQLPPKMRVGVVSFSETSYLNQAPTTNRTQIKNAIERLYPRTGTAIGHGLSLSLETLYNSMGELPILAPGQYAPAVIILLTDGENTDGPSPLQVIQPAIERGIRIYTIGVGSPESSTVTVGSTPIQARLDEATLKELARLTEGKYYNASTEQDLRAVYQNLTTQLVTRFQPQDISFLFLAAAFVTGVCTLMFSIVWSSRLP